VRDVALLGGDAPRPESRSNLPPAGAPPRPDLDSSSEKPLLAPPLLSGSRLTAAGAASASRSLPSTAPRRSSSVSPGRARAGISGAPAARDKLPPHTLPTAPAGLPVARLPPVPAGRNAATPACAPLPPPLRSAAARAAAPCLLLGPLAPPPLASPPRHTLPHVAAPHRRLQYLPARAPRGPPLLLARLWSPALETTTSGPPPAVPTICVLRFSFTTASSAGSPGHADRQ
jgi:hypothetical protein